ncbi:glycoside hydrolase family 88 protein [Acidobacteriota bacterium]
MRFYPEDTQVPSGLNTEEFVLRPLRAEYPVRIRRIQGAAFFRDTEQRCGALDLWAGTVASIFVLGGFLYSQKENKMNLKNRKRTILSTFIIVCILLGCIFGQIYASEPKDWSVLTVESVMARKTPSEIGSWSYQNALLLHGIYRVWQRTGDSSYFQYIKDWVDLHVDANGNIDAGIGSLDNMLPGRLILSLYEETNDARYKKAADTIRSAFYNWPTTSSGGICIYTSLDQLWLDGLYMSLPFLVQYGTMFDDEVYCYNTAAEQLKIYADHLKDVNTGLLFHAYDDDGSASWADPVTHHSAEFWGRSIGWYSMALVDVLEYLPEDHPDRNEILTILQDLVAGLANAQDETGLWHQVVDKGHLSDNWLETSCTCMFTYSIAKAVENGYVNASYINTAMKGFSGLQTKSYLDGSDLTVLTQISVGTSVGDYNYYINRKHSTNDYHGIGAFLIVNEQMQKYLSKYGYIGDADGSIEDLDTCLTKSGEDFYIIPLLTNETRTNLVDFYEIIYVDARAHEGNAAKLRAEYQKLNDYVYDGGVTVLFEYRNAPTRSGNVFQAEDASLYRANVNNIYAGYTHTGFVDYINEAGSYIEWAVQVPGSDNVDWAVNVPVSYRYGLTFRYANGTTQDRQMEIRVNGNIVESALSFAGTGAWPSWDVQKTTAYLNSGKNTIRATAITSNGGPNVDKLELSGGPPTLLSTSVLSYLPYQIYTSNSSGTTHKISQPTHAIFASPYSISKIGGMKEDSTITDLSARWDTLATNSLGDPSIVEARFGSGWIIVCQPKVPRYYANDLNDGDYDDLLENIVTHAKSRKQDRRDNEAPTKVSNGIVEFEKRNGLHIKWNVSTDNKGVVEYKLYRSTTRGFTPGPGNFIGAVKQHTYTEYDLSSATTYYYRIAAVDAAGNRGTYSDEIPGTTLTPQTAWR